MLTGMPNPSTFGGARMVRLFEDCAVPLGDVTERGPLVAPSGTIVRICVALSTVNAAAGVPLNPMAEAPVRLVPLIVIDAPTGSAFALK